MVRPEDEMHCRSRWPRPLCQEPGSRSRGRRTRWSRIRWVRKSGWPRNRRRWNYWPEIMFFVSLDGSCDLYCVQVRSKNWQKLTSCVLILLLDILPATFIRATFIIKLKPRILKLYLRFSAVVKLSVKIANTKTINNSRARPLYIKLTGVQALLLSQAL